MFCDEKWLEDQNQKKDKMEDLSSIDLHIYDITWCNLDQQKRNPTRNEIKLSHKEIYLVEETNQVTINRCVNNDCTKKPTSQKEDAKKIMNITMHNTMKE